jgi:hypothetical protein
MEKTETGNNVLENKECYLFSIKSEIDTSAAPAWQDK